MDFNEKKEQIVNSYKKSYDKNVAYMKCGLTKEEITILERDKDFQDRLTYILAEQKEYIIGRLTTLSSSADKDSVALAAVTKLGEIIYAEAFAAVKDSNKTELILPLETQKKLKDIFSSGALDAWKKQMQERLLTSDENPEDIVNEIIN